MRSAAVAFVLVTACGQAAPAPKPAPATVAKVDELPGVPTLTISATALVIDGSSLVAVRDGAFDPADKEGGAAGMAIPKLTTFLEAWRRQVPGPKPDVYRADGGQLLRIVVDPTTPYRLLIECLFSAKQKPAGYTEFTIAMATNRDLVVPLALPSTRNEAIFGDNLPLSLAVSVASDRALLWSFDGSEGTLKTPKAEWPIAGAAAPLQAGLLEIATRRFAGKPRAIDTNRIVAMFDGATPMATALPLLAAMRCPPGRPNCGPAADGVAYDPATMGLFPDVVLSSGFE